jgi:hypothetical protein
MFRGNIGGDQRCPDGPPRKRTFREEKVFRPAGGIVIFSSIDVVTIGSDYNKINNEYDVIVLMEGVHLCIPIVDETRLVLERRRLFISFSFKKV